MPKPAARATNPSPLAPIPAMDRQKEKETGLSRVTALSSEFAPVTDEGSYLAADSLLGNIQRFRKVWRAKFYGNDEKSGPIPHIRLALDQLYAIVRDVDKPAETLEGKVKRSMADYKLAETRRIAAAAQAQREEQDQLLREEMEQRNRAGAARTPQVAARLKNIADKLAEKREQAAQEPIDLPVTGLETKTKTVYTPTVTDVQAFCAGIAKGLIDSGHIEVRVKPLLDAYKADPDGVSQWPGVTIVEDVQIVGRG